jgi:2-keto-4-pentenoate hydratase
LKARAEIHPRIVAALDAQLAHWRAAIDAGAQRVGWKMGLGVEPVEALIGGDPVIGYLTSATVIDSGQAYSASASRELRAETELAIVVGDDIEGDVDLDSARDAIAGCAVALELVDVAAPPHDLEGIVEANVYHRAVVLGPPRRRRAAAGGGPDPLRIADARAGRSGRSRRGDHRRSRQPRRQDHRVGPARRRGGAPGGASS